MTYQHLTHLLTNPPAAARGMSRWWWYGCAVTREEIARVFTVLRDDARHGNATVTERGLLERAAPMGMVKLRLILRILNEMGVCRVRDPLDGIFVFEINFDSPKTSIDASPLMQRLRSQLIAGGA